MKPMLKASGSKCLNLKHADLLSNVAFKSNLRRYSEEEQKMACYSMKPPPAERA